LSPDNVIVTVVAVDGSVFTEGAVLSIMLKFGVADQTRSGISGAVTTSHYGIREVSAAKGPACLLPNYDRIYHHRCDPLGTLCHIFLVLRLGLFPWPQVVNDKCRRISAPLSLILCPILFIFLDGLFQDAFV
jgi:hypothetical protein